MKKITKKEKPEIYALNKGEEGWELSRRSFLSKAAVAGIALAVTGGKKGAEGEALAPFPDFRCPQVTAHSGAVTSLAFTRDGKFLISGSKDEKVKIWDVSKQGLVKVLSKHTEAITVGNVSPDSNWFLSGSDDEKVAVWNVDKQKYRSSFIKHGREISGIGITPDSNKAVSADRSGAIKYWRIPGGSLIKGWTASGSIYGLAVSPNGKLLATGSWDNVQLWSLDTGEAGKFIREFGKHDGNIDNLVFTPDSRSLVTGGSYSSYLKIWSIPTGDPIKKIGRAHPNKVYSLAMSPDGNFMASGGKDSFVKIWNLPGGTLKNKLSIGNVFATSLAISPDSTIVAVGQDDGKIRLCKALTNDHLGCLMDLDTNENTKDGVKYKYQDSSGRWITVTIPGSSCARPLPAGAVCVCNTVPGACSCVGHTCSCVGYTCSCQGQCSCVGYGHYWYPN